MEIFRKCFFNNYVENKKVAQPHLYHIEIKEEKTSGGRKSDLI